MSAASRVAMVTVANDMKVQLEFDPSAVEQYRQIGYENRALANKDFEDDTKDAGELGSGHTVTALYELIPAGQTVPPAGSDANPFVANAHRDSREVIGNPDIALRLRLRYKKPDGDTSLLQDCSTLCIGDGHKDAAVHEARFF